jgi:ABC-type transport system involved in multi-copper enzyme maturation permease subunit
VIAPLRWLRSMNPFGLPGAGPWAVFQKEVRVSGRRTGTYWARGLYAAGFCAFIGMVLITIVADSVNQTSSVVRLQNMQRIAPMIAMIILWFQLIGLIFCAPLLLGPALCDERRNKTLSALLTTPLTAGQIVAGKLLSQITLLGVFALVPVPILLAIRIFGGLDGVLVIAATAVALGAAVLAASWALASSLRAARGVNAAMGAWAKVLFFNGVVPPVLYFMSMWVGRTTGMFINIPQWVPAAFCPPWALGMLSSDMVGTGSGYSPWSIVFTSLAGSLGTSLLLWIWTAATLRRAAAAGGGEFAEPLRKPFFGGKSKKQLPGQENNVHARVASIARPSRVVTDAPVLWRELRIKTVRSFWRIAAVLIAICAWVGLMILSDIFNSLGTHIATCIIGAIIFAFIASVMTTSTIGGEREAKTLPILLMTPLTELQIVWGKFCGGVFRLWPILALLLIETLVLMPIAGYFYPLSVFLYFINLMFAGMFLCACGVFWSLCIRRVTTAGVVSLLVMLSTWIGIPMALALLLEFGSGGGEYILSVSFCANPIALGIASFATQDTMGWIAPTSDRIIEVGGFDFTVPQFILLCTCVWIGYGVLTWSILRYTAFTLRRRRDQMA